MDKLILRLAKPKSDLKEQGVRNNSQHQIH